MPKSRIEVKIPNVGTQFVVVGISNQPARYSILRARAEILSGPATQVALKVMERESGPDISTILEYTLSDNPIDAWENGEIFFYARERAGLNNTGTGTTFIGVKCNTQDNNGGGNTIEVHLDVLLES